MENMGKRLKRLRMEKKLSIKEVCEKIEVPQSTYREWEYGREIKGEPYVKIAHAFEVSLIELLTGEKPNPQKVFKILEMLEENLRDLRTTIL